MQKGKKKHKRLRRCLSSPSREISLLRVSVHVWGLLAAGPITAPMHMYNVDYFTTDLSRATPSSYWVRASNLGWANPKEDGHETIEKLMAPFNFVSHFCSMLILIRFMVKDVDNDIGFLSILFWIRFMGKDLFLKISVTSCVDSIIFLKSRVSIKGFVPLCTFTWLWCIHCTNLSISEKRTGSRIIKRIITIIISHKGKN